MKSKRSPDQNNQIAEVQLIYKSKTKAADRVQVTTSKETFELLKSLWNMDTIELQEEFKVLLLNRSSQVLGLMHLSSGGISGTVADPKLIFVAALKAAASAIILCHNHPSGQVRPSRSDEAATGKIRMAGDLLNIQLLDHLIITNESYFSFADEGLL